MRLRQHIDGSFWITRPNKQFEKELDTKYVRVKGALRWFPKGHNKELEDFRDKYQGQTCYIIGKGPSLDALRASDFKTNGPILCVNDSVKKINKLNHWAQPTFVLQQDATLREECRPNHEDCVIIVAPQSRAWYTDHKKRVIMVPEALGAQHAGPSVIVAICIAELLGCSKLVLISFDAATHKECDYANVIGYPATRAGDTSRFLNHKTQMLRKLDATGLNYEFFTPSGLLVPKEPTKPNPDGIDMHCCSPDLGG